MTELSRFLLESGIATADSVRGCTDSEITQLEHQLSVRLPMALVECLREMGHACGRLADGDLFGIEAFNEAREVALEITTEQESPWRLPDNAVPFLHHHGYEFLFLYANAGDDPPVWLYIGVPVCPICTRKHSRR